MARTATERDFQWRGRDTDGQRREGRIRARGAGAARSELQRQGLQVERIRRARRGGRIKSADIALFARQLAVMVNAGVPLVQGLGIIAEGFDSPAMRHLIEDLKADIEGGSPLSTALERHPAHFDPLFCNLVAVGEQTGRLDELLNRIADTRERLEAIKSKVRKALAYPTVVLVVALAITALMLVVVVPAFQGLFAGFDAELPAITRWVIGLSEFAQARGPLILLLLILGGAGAAWGYRRSPTLQRRAAGWLLRLPLLGNIVRKAAIGRFARTQATLFSAGVPLVEGMDSVAGAMGNPVYADAITRIRDRVATGQSLQQALAASGLFPNMVVQMVAIGEETGSLDTMLAKVADFYEAEVNDAVDTLSSLMEPIVMVVLGGLIGGLVVAMYLPVFQMGQAIG
ncbi:MAG: type II secretion system F family protein [Thiohalospira sp.]